MLLGGSLDTAQKFVFSDRYRDDDSRNRATASVTAVVFG